MKTSTTVSTSAEILLQQLMIWQYGRMDLQCTERRYDFSHATCRSAESVREVRGWKIEPSQQTTKAFC